jgi:1-acyl-sn-glycerol-3-phosphate acyltransferase
MSSWVYWPAGHVVRFLIWFFGGCRVDGLGNLPRTGAVIMVANHHSLTDPPIVGTMTFHRIGRVVHIMAKAEINGWPVIGYLARHAGAIFVRRGEGDRAAQRLGLELLAAGEPLLIFPEGTRSHERVLREGKAGAVLLALRSGVPLLPVGIIGSQELLVWNFLFRRRPRCIIRIGEPVQLAHRPDGRLDRDELAAGTELMMRSIAALLPPESRGRYG